MGELEIPFRQLIKQSIMPTQRILADPDFGKIFIRTRRSARNVTMRVKSDGRHLTVPLYSKTEKILEVIVPYRERLLENFKKVALKPLDYSYTIQAPCFHLYIKEGTLSYFSVKEKNEEMYIFCPPETDFSNEAVQKLLHAAIVRAMKKRAAACLPPILAMWAERYGFNYKKVRITGACSRWGSCSSAGTISLSCYLMLLPSHLMDYVMLHELTHTKEMNHGPKFWELLDKLTGGCALQLRKELRDFHTGLPLSDGSK